MRSYNFLQINNFRLFSKFKSSISNLQILSNNVFDVADIRPSPKSIVFLILY